MSDKVRKNENLEKVWKVNFNLNTEKFKRSKLPEKYIAKILFE